MGSKPPAAVGVRVSKGERHDFGAAVPSSISASSLKQGRARSLVKSSPELVELIRPAWPFLQNSYPHASFDLQ